CAIDAGDFCGRNAIFIPVAPCEGDKCHDGADEGHGGQPPDVPDHREAQEGREKGADDPGRTVARHFDVLVDRLRPKRMRLDGALLCDPISIPAFDPWKHGEVTDRPPPARPPLYPARI